MPSPMSERSRPVLASLAAFPAIQSGRHPHHSPRCVRGHSHTSRPARSLNRPNDGPFAAECFSPMPLLPCTAGTPSGWTDGQPNRIRTCWGHRVFTAHDIGQVGCRGIARPLSARLVSSACGATRRIAALGDAQPGPLALRTRERRTRVWCGSLNGAPLPDES